LYPHFELEGTTMTSSFEPMRVGALASATGISIRTLHYYDEIGLLAPTLRSEGGHRLYGADDIGRLQQILSLRALGFSLEEIAACLDNDEELSPRSVIGRHIERLSIQRALASGGA
jgi:MerR family transcriptional regulator, thiopeptide resistance regulator